MVHIKSGLKTGFYIPLPLAVLDVTLASLHDCLAFWGDLFPHLIRRKFGLSGTKNRPKLAELLALVIRMIDELRSYGSYELVRVEDEKNKISVRLY